MRGDESGGEGTTSEGCRIISADGNALLWDLEGMQGILRINNEVRGFNAR